MIVCVLFKSSTSVIVFSLSTSATSTQYILVQVCECEGPQLLKAGTYFTELAKLTQPEEREHMTEIIFCLLSLSLYVYIYIYIYIYKYVYFIIYIYIYTYNVMQLVSNM